MDLHDTSITITDSRKRKAPDIDFCIICQKSQGGKLTSTPNGREKIIQGSIKMEDDLLCDVSDENRCKIQYHTKCYKPYILLAQRVKTDSASSSSIEVEGEAESSATLHDRSKDCV